MLGPVLAAEGPARVSPCGANCGNIQIHEPSHSDQGLEDVRCRSARERRDGRFHFRLPDSWYGAARQRSRPLHRLRPDGENSEHVPPHAIEEEISKALGSPVGITTRDVLHPSMKNSIERDAVRVT